MTAQFIEPNKVTSEKFVRVIPKIDSFGNSKLGKVTHFTRIPSTNPQFAGEEGWEDIVYLCAKDKKEVMFDNILNLDEAI